jgi:hypothetical protein
MNRLQQELQRLYGPQADPDVDQAAGPADAPGQVPATVRALVLELARPADWAALSATWAGVQADLALPAPAIAVNGSDGCQLWFSLQAPVPVPRAAAFLDALRRRYLGDMAPARVGLWPALHDAPPPLPARPVPALQADSGQWSAFITPDLVPMFSDEPWLVVPPNPDGQAKLLAPLHCITPAAFDLAWQRLLPAEVPAAATAAVPAAVHAAPGPAAQATAPSVGGLDPRRFLLDVMNNDHLDLALRIDAAKALLPCFDAAQGRRPGGDGDRSA